MIALAVAALALAGLFAGVSFANLAILRPPRPANGPAPRVAVLIPARDEAANIADALASITAQEGAELEIVVLDDGSTDGTGAIVGAAAAADPRIRCIAGSPLAPGANGKQQACATLAAAATAPVLLFVDADVRLAPGAVAAMAGEIEREGLDLLSGIPRQETATLGERLVVPLIPVLMFGYLPLAMARMSGSPGFAAACGQLVMVRRAAYEAAGGHGAFLRSSHDGLHLPRNVRRAGGRTDLADVTSLASCRMYEDWPSVWKGFSKNATEGMATRRALPVWTVLLFGGHVLPPLTALLAALTGNGAALAIALLATGLLAAARVAIARRFGQSAAAVALHPAAICTALAIQYSALLNARRGGTVEWRGRRYGA